MRVKRYIVDTMPDAMLKIRTDLGSDAVILSTKELKTGGFMGMFQKKKIEVIAAVEKEQVVDNTAAAEPAPRPVIELPVAAPVPKKAVPDAYRKSSQAFAESMRQALAASETSEPERSQKEEVDTPIVPVAAPLQPKHIAVPAEVQSYPEHAIGESMSEERLFEELKQMKKMMTELAREKDMAGRPEALTELADYLKTQGIAQSMIDEWIDQVAQQHTETAELNAVEARRAIKKQIEQFTETRIGGGIQADTKIVYIAGPTGVGKTTTIAKLAAEQLFKYKRKVGFITSDTYRISAVEQLRTYASILGVPLEVVQSPGDLQRSLQRLEECDLILMDTAGRNYRNELLVSELQSLLAPLEQSETYLVLALTSKTEDMRTITEHFSKYPLDKVIFTKADETGSYGALFNLLQEYPLRLSYMTNGQNVPDDLLMPSPEFLANILLGEILP